MERNAQNCKCCTCKHSRLFYTKSKQLRTDKDFLLLCCEDNVEAGDTGTKPKLHCDWYKKFTPKLF
jgi:hypothetical protein